jgi:hypothetical protein
MARITIGDRYKFYSMPQGSKKYGSASPVIITIIRMRPYHDDPHGRSTRLCTCCTKREKGGRQKIKYLQHNE